MLRSSLMVPGSLTILAMEPKMIDLNVIYLFGLFSMGPWNGLFVFFSIFSQR